jgi:hypothetical protein
MARLRVELTDGAGRTIDEIRDGGGLRELLPTVNDQRFACWRFVDPYGETVFNHLQLPILRREIALLRPGSERVKSVDVDHILDLVEDLAANRSGVLHRYLRFVAE